MLAAGGARGGCTLRAQAKERWQCGKHLLLLSSLYRFAASPRAAPQGGWPLGTAQPQRPLKRVLAMLQLLGRTKAADAAGAVVHLRLGARAALSAV
jgi:hypothetical protein